VIRTKLLKFLDSGRGTAAQSRRPGTQGADAALVLPRFVLPFHRALAMTRTPVPPVFCRRFTGESSSGREINPFPFGLIFDITYS
jgi:hypothetical protein